MGWLKRAWAFVAKKEPAVSAAASLAVAEFATETVHGAPLRGAILAAAQVALGYLVRAHVWPAESVAGLLREPLPPRG